MGKTLFAYKKFNFLFLSLFVCWCLTHVWILHSIFGFTWITSIYDSVIFNFSLAGTAIILNVILVFYRPIGKSLWISGSMVLALSILWIFKTPDLLQWVIIPEENYRPFLEQSIIVRFIFGLMINLGVLGMSWFWYGLEEQKEERKRRQTLEDLAKEAELISLRLKLQPHFLFNSLNSISALVLSHPDLARNMIQQLSDFLRSTLRQEENQKITIQEELHQLQLYLNIEQVRFGHRLNTVIDVEDGIQANVPAMILQPVVENAIKFGLYDTVGVVDIHISVQCLNNSVSIRVSNPFDPSSRKALDSGTGFGLRSISRRLYLIYARNDLVSTLEENDQFITEITIPQ